MPVPKWPVHVPKALLENIQCGKTLPFQTIDDYWSVNGALKEALESVPFERFRIYDVVERFGSESLQMMSEEGKPFYFDEGHLTLTGSRLLLPVFEKILIDISESLPSISHSLD